MSLLSGCMTVCCPPVAANTLHPALGTCLLLQQAYRDAHGGTQSCSKHNAASQRHLGLHAAVHCRAQRGTRGR